MIALDNYRYVADVIATLIAQDARLATKYLSDKLTIKASRKLFQGKFNKNTIEVVLTIGKPNFAERQFIKDCKKAGVPFPVKNIQLKFPPKKGKK